MQDCAEKLAQDYLPPGWQRLSTSPFTQVAVHEATGLFFKFYFHRSPLGSLQNRWLGSPAQRFVDNNRALAKAGFRTPETVYSGEVKGLGEFIFSQQIEGEPICLWLERLSTEKHEHGPKWMLLQSLGIAVGRLHTSGFIHGQLSSQNILASHTQNRFSIFFTNNENVIRRRAPSGRQVAQELRRLHFSLPVCTKKTDKMRLFKAWRRQMCHLHDVEANILAREIYTSRFP